MFRAFRLSSVPSVTSKALDGRPTVPDTGTHTHERLVREHGPHSEPSVSPLFKMVVLAWLVIGPVGLWLRRRRRRAT
ncbi:MAG TPA: hypothetical protein VJ463_02855 [Geothrix sp.]|nr:hypothetical protein [Geothrix sp.]